mmetsp:Transcript_29535/g.68682  ORF Transcript_29535/g.68682 Transcript_29535/m.68682 type:complete len:218 (+) Transcript_29535:548-1201(+)
MAAHNRDLCGLARDLLHKLVGPHDVQRRDSHNLAGVEALLLPELTHGWHNRVHRVHDEPHDGIGAVLGNRLNCALGNVRVDLQEVLPVLSWLPWHACRNQHEVAALQDVAGFVNGLVLVECQRERVHLALPFEMREVGGNTCCWHHSDVQVDEHQLLHQRVQSHQQGQGLPDSTSAANNADFEVASGNLLRAEEAEAARHVEGGKLCGSCGGVASAA